MRPGFGEGSQDLPLFSRSHSPRIGRLAEWMIPGETPGPRSILPTLLKPQLKNHTKPSVNVQASSFWLFR